MATVSHVMAALALKELQQLNPRLATAVINEYIALADERMLKTGKTRRLSSGGKIQEFSEERTLYSRPVADMLRRPKNVRPAGLDGWERRKEGHSLGGFIDLGNLSITVGESSKEEYIVTRTAIPLFVTYFGTAATAVIKHSDDWMRESTKEQIEFCMKQAENLLCYTDNPPSLPVEEKQSPVSEEIWQNPEQESEKEPMLEKSVTVAKRDLKSIGILSARRQAGRTALAIIHTAVFRKLPMKWSWWARVTGKKERIIGHPLTKVATAAAAYGILVAVRPDGPELAIARGALHFAVDDALDKGFKIEEIVAKAMNVSQEEMNSLVKTLSDAE